MKKVLDIVGTSWYSIKAVAKNGSKEHIDNWTAKHIILENSLHWMFLEWNKPKTVMNGNGIWTNFFSQFQPVTMDEIFSESSILAQDERWRRA